MSKKYFNGLLVGWLAGRIYTWIVFAFVLDYPNVLEPIWTHMLGGVTLFVLGFLIYEAFSL